MRLDRRTYYTDYVNHSIRFFFTSTEGIAVKDYSKADVNNWIAVQAVLSDLPENEYDLIKAIYTTRGRFEEKVQAEAEARGVKESDIWKIIMLTCNRIARMRGLI